MEKLIVLECPYCAPDGTIWNGDSSKICPYCKGIHYEYTVKEEKK